LAQPAEDSITTAEVGRTIACRPFLNGSINGTVTH
jgi:hypothetical protein